MFWWVVCDQTLEDRDRFYHACYQGGKKALPKQSNHQRLYV